MQPNNHRKQAESADWERAATWLQYCVYGTFRVQDDLVDGDTTDARLAVQTNHLLVEAARCAARHFDGSSTFWSGGASYPRLSTDWRLPGRSSTTSETSALTSEKAA